jgi:hypothetical protein
LLAKVVNDDARSQVERGALEFLASKLAPTVEGRVSGKPASVATIHQPEFPGLGERITDGLDSLGLGQQALAFGGRDIIQRQAGNALFIAGQYHHQQFIALVPGQGAGRLGHGGDGVQGLLRLPAEGIGQGQVAAAVEVFGLQAQALGESALRGNRLAIQHLGNPQPGIGHRQPADIGRLAQGRHRSLGLAQAQLRGPQPQQRLGALRIQLQGLLEGLFRPPRVVAVEPRLAEFEPRIDAGTRLLGRTFVQRRRAGVVATFVQVIGQLQGAIAIARGLAGARGQQQAAGEQEGGVNGFGHRHNSLGEGGRHVSIFSMAVLWLSVLFGASLVNAAEAPDWFAQPYAYVLVDQDVRTALEEFGHNLDLPVVLSDKVRGKARSTVRAATAGEFLQTLCSTNGLTWYFDGNLLYLNASDEITTKLFKANALNLDQLQSYLGNLDVFGQQLSMRNGPEGDEVFVSGPPPYLALVQQHVDHLQPKVAAAPMVVRERGVRVFRGAQVSTETP